MAPKLKFGAKPGAKSGAKFGTKHGAKWYFGAKLDTAIMLHRPSVSLHRVRSNIVQKPERSIGIWQHLVSILLQRSQHVAHANLSQDVRSAYCLCGATVLHTYSLCNVIVHCCRKYAGAVWRYAGGMQQYTGPVQQKNWPCGVSCWP